MKVVAYIQEIDVNHVDVYFKVDGAHADGGHLFHDANRAVEYLHEARDAIERGTIIVHPPASIPGRSTRPLVRVPR